MQSSHCDASTSFSTIRSSRGLRPEASKGIFTGCHLAKRRSRSCPVIRQTVSKIRLSCQKLKDRDPITAYRTEPEFFADLNGNGRDAKALDRGVANQFLEFQRGRIDLHDVRCLRGRGSSLTGSEERAAGRPAEIVHTKANWNAILLDRRLPPRQANERLATPSPDIQPLRVFGDLQDIHPDQLPTRFNLRSGDVVPFPHFTASYAAHHCRVRV